MNKVMKNLKKRKKLILVKKKEAKKTLYYGKKPKKENQNGIRHGAKEDQVGILNVQ